MRSEIKNKNNKTATTRAERVQDQPAENQENTEKTRAYIIQLKDSKLASSSTVLKASSTTTGGI